jgi:UDP-3-O-[3-hydroxymyristoyl] N-acetylglucosamine deacetylase
MVTQKTLGGKVTLDGIGLHTGEPVSVDLSPAAPDSGIRFFRSGCLDHGGVLAHPANVVSTDRSTTLGCHGVYVRTVEHLMAALYSERITNCVVTVSAEELPVLDGSAAPFIEAIRSVGSVDQGVPVRSAKVTTSALIEQGSGLIAVAPSDGFSVTYVASYPETPIGIQITEYVEGRDDFAAAVAPARTLGFSWEVEQLLARGLARGGSLDCAVVADHTCYLTDLRFDDEVARHKILDTVGDFYLMGLPRMRVVCVRSGHRLNSAMCRKLLSDGIVEMLPKVGSPVEV